MILPLLLFAAALGAVEGDAKAEARALYGEAVKSLDVWTMLQLEAWSANNGGRLHSALPGVEMIGEPLFATPFTISHLHNLPDRVVVTTRDRVYQWAVDGRPLSLSWPLPFGTWEDTVEPLGQALGLLGRRSNDDDTRTFSLAAVSLGDGSVRSSSEFSGPSGEHTGAVAVAPDASAVAAELHGESTRVIVAIGKEQRILGGWRRPRALGRNGAWMIADNGNDRTLITQGGATTRLRDSATGPGSAAVLIKDQASLVKDDGSLAAMEVPMGLGKDAQLVTVGAWLVIASGPGALSKPAIDVLGNLSGGGQPQPPRCAFYRWRDLLADPAAPPVAVEDTSLVVAESEAAAVFRWHGPTIELMDLAGDQPVMRPFATAPGDISWIEAEFQVVTVSLADGKRWLLDATGKELLQPTPGWLEVHSRDWALARAGADGKEAYQAIHLSVDSTKRNAAPLQIDPGEWRVVLPTLSDQVVAWRDDLWRRLDAFTGKVIAQGDAESRPSVDRSWDPRGRFYARGPRVLRKTAPSPGRQWNALDVWRTGRVTTILDRDERVWISRKRGEWLDLGQTPGSDRLVRCNGDLGVSDRDGKVLATITSAGRLDAPRPMLGELPPGLWQVRDLQFVPPRSGNQVWNPATGLFPEYLRCCEDGLLVPLASVVLVLDPAGGKALGRPR
jgi:hypothetical protein